MLWSDTWVNDKYTRTTQHVFEPKHNPVFIFLMLKRVKVEEVRHWASGLEIKTSLTLFTVTSTQLWNFQFTLPLKCTYIDPQTENERARHILQQQDLIKSLTFPACMTEHPKRLKASFINCLTSRFPSVTLNLIFYGPVRERTDILTNCYSVEVLVKRKKMMVMFSICGV